VAKEKKERTYLDYDNRRVREDQNKDVTRKKDAERGTKEKKPYDGRTRRR